MTSATDRFKMTKSEDVTPAVYLASHRIQPFRGSIKTAFRIMAKTMRKCPGQESVHSKTPEQLLSDREVQLEENLVVSLTSIFPPNFFYILYRIKVKLFYQKRYQIYYYIYTIKQILLNTFQTLLKHLAFERGKSRHILTQLHS